MPLDETRQPASIRPGDRYVAIGSSYAAGPWVGKPAAGSPKKAGRSSSNYAHHLAAKLQLDLTDVTYSGATVDEMLNGSANGEPPQIDAVTADTRLVTITGGGNDVAYIPRLAMGALPFPLSLLPGVRRQVSEFDTPEATDAKFAKLEVDFAAIVTEIRHRAPNVTIALVEYLRILPPDAATPIGRFPSGLAAWGRDAYDRLSTLTRSVAADTGCVFVATAAASAAHHAWSAEPWTRRLQLSRGNGAPYHPNALGMKSVAKLIAHELMEPPGPHNISN